MPTMPSAPRSASQDRLLEHLYATDPQISAARGLPEITAAVDRPDLPLTELVSTLMTAYAERPAVGERAREPVLDPATGRTTFGLLPHYDTITYGELWQRAGAVAAEWHAHARTPVRAGDFVGILGAGSIDFTVVDLAVLRLGAAAVTLQAGATTATLTPIIAETGQRLLATSSALLETAAGCALAAPTVQRVLVFDHHPEIDDDRERFEEARTRLAAAGIALDTLSEVTGRGQDTPPAPEFRAAIADDHVALLVYTSGSTGTPKGAIYTDRMVVNGWLDLLPRYPDLPRISLNYLPTSHMMGRAILYSTFSTGGTAYFSASTDMSTFFDDLPLIRPTELVLVPRVCDTLFQDYTNLLDRTAEHTGDDAARVLAGMRERLLGGRVVWAVCASAPLSRELQEFMESLLGVPLHDAYGLTEAACVLTDGLVLRPSVLDVKLEDVPELGYFTTDTPHPRGELLVKSEYLFPGYHRRPELTAKVIDADGYYHTGDIMAGLGPDRYGYVDRRSNVLKLSQGEFVAVSRLEALFVASPLIQQIYVYGSSERSFLLAIIVPTPEALASGPGLDSALRAALRGIADEAGLNSYEVPRDFLIETEPFSTGNGLLSGVRKLVRPRLKAHYGEQLERLYRDLSESESRELHALRRSGREQPVLETVQRAVRAALSITGEVSPDARFLELGGDSLAALSFSQLLREIFDVEIPVGSVISAAGTLRHLAGTIETTLRSGATRPTAATVHDAGAVRASDLTLGAFLDEATLAAAHDLPAPSGTARTVLLTGANGYLGRFLCLDWLERLSERDGKLICVIRGSDADAARQRLRAAFDSGDATLLRRFDELAATHLEVLAGDIGEPALGLDEPTWRRLAETVDLIAHPAALVNHVLPYEQLFGPNVAGTAEVIRMALTARLKPITFLSTVAVLMADVTTADEDADIRISSAERRPGEDYAGGYATSKWAAEVLLREANDAYDLPVAVFRSDLILAHSRFTGQLNVPDMFTRLLYSVAVSGIAPRSFYRSGAAHAHFDGLPADFTAEAITTLGEQAASGYRTYNTLNPHDDGISLDTVVGWLTEAGLPITRIDDYAEWFTRFEGKLRALPDRQKRHSVLPLLHAYREPAEAVAGAGLPTERFRAAVRDAKIGPDQDIPRLSAALIHKYVSDLRGLGLLG